MPGGGLAQLLQGPPALEHICPEHAVKKTLAWQGCHQGSEAGGWKE